MSALFFSPLGRNLFYLCLVIYLYGDLAIYGAAVAKSLRGTWPIKIIVIWVYLYSVGSVADPDPGFFTPQIRDPGWTNGRIRIRDPG
jgi:hypothetical protein